MVSFYWQDWDVSQFCATTGMKITNLSYVALKNVFYLIESFHSAKRFWIVLEQKSSSKCAINVGVTQNFLSDILCFK